MSEPIVHWNILPEYLGIYLFKWAQDNPPVPFLRKGRDETKHHGKARAPWQLTEAGRADLEEWRARPK